MTTPEYRISAKWWLAGALVLVLIAVADAFVPHHPHFERDGITLDTMPEFFPLYGFFSCFAMVIVAKSISTALRRKDNYYADD